MEATRTAIVGRKCVSSADSNAECWLIVDDVNPSLLLRMLLVSSIFYSTQKSVYQYNKLNYTWLSECLCVPVLRHSTTKKLLVIIITYLCYSLYGWFYTSGLSQNPQHHQCILQVHNKKSINQPTNQPTSQPINQPTNQSINQSINPDQHCRIPGIPHFLAQSNHQKLVIPGIGDKSRLYLFGVYYVFFFKRC